VTNIGDLKTVLAGTKYEDDILCIQATLDAAGIKTINDLDNAPIVLTFCVCNYDTYPLLSDIRERVLNPPKPVKAVSKPKKVSASTKKKVLPKPKVVEELPPLVVEIEPENEVVGKDPKKE